MYYLLKKYALLFLFCASSICFVAKGQTIDPNKPLTESLKPNILYLNFNEEDESYQHSDTPNGLVASVEWGKVDALPSLEPGPGEAFGRALRFGYGSTPPFEAEAINEQLMGNHLEIKDEPALRLLGTSFTLGAWIKVPEDIPLPYKSYKVLFSKGGYSVQYPGWKLQLSSRNETTWSLLLQLIDAEGNQSSMTTWATFSDFEVGKWHHVAASFDAATQKITIWLDGIAVLSKESRATVGESERPLIIGESGMSTFSNIPIVMDEVFITSGVHDFLPVTE